jgi:hypothetical protein
MKLRTWLALALLLPECATLKPKALPDGSYRLLCSSTLGQCLHRAKQFCGDDELYVIKKTDGTVYGVEGHESGAEGAEVHFRCSKPRAEPQWKLPARRVPAAPSSSAPAASSARAVPPQACIPGETQRCVGPGACEGGQACLPDGSGFGPCDCGSEAPDAGADAAVPRPSDAGGELHPDAGASEGGGSVAE